MTLKTSLISIAAALIVGFIGGMLVIKKSNVGKQTQQTTSTQNDIVTVTKTRKTSKGDVTTVTTTTDKSTQTKEKETVAITPKGKDYHVNALIGYNFDKTKPSYGLSIDKQFIGPVRLGVFGNTDKVFGVTVGFEF